jgi:threonine dehydrogenase-like Zn-dependent dehydrogenase
MPVVAQVARLLAPRTLAFEEQPLDVARLEPDAVFATTLCSAISVGTEMAAYLGEPPLRPGPVYPRLVGYCNVAQVRAVGAAVRGLVAGQRILTFQSHRSAFICRQDEVLLVLPEGASEQLAATTYLFHFGHHALLKAGFERGQQVAVIGLGTLGVAAVALAASLGARVSAYSDQAPALELARSFGAAGAFPKTLPAGAPGADVVITTSNRWADWRLALGLAREGAALCVLGFPGRGQPAPDFNPLDPQFFYDRQLRILACGKAPRDELRKNCAFLLGEVLGGRLPARRLIDQVHPWQELGAVYEALARRQGGQLTRLLQW